MVGMVACGYHLRANTPLRAALVIVLGWCCASKKYIATEFFASLCVDFKVSCYFTVGPSLHIAFRRRFASVASVKY